MEQNCLFSRYDIWRTGNFRKNYFHLGFLDFFVNISTRAKAWDNIDKKVLKTLEKVDLPEKFLVIP